jgi:hypothetical protein
VLIIELIIRLVWWSQLVTSPLWAQELSFELLLERASTYILRQQASFLPERVPGLYLPILAMSSQVYNLPFGMPLSHWQMEGLVLESLHIVTMSRISIFQLQEALW